MKTWARAVVLYAALGAIASLSGCTDEESCSRALAVDEWALVQEVSCRGDDWIEIAAPPDRSIDLSGWSLSDRKDRSPDERYVFPDGTCLEPAGVLVLYEDVELPFGLKCGEEGAFLWNADGELREAEPVPDLLSGQSWARIPEGIADFQIARQTAGRPNEVPLTFPFDNRPSSSDGPCAEASSRWGESVCICGPAALAAVEQLSVAESGYADVDWTTKYFVPVHEEDGPLPSLVQNTSLFPLHVDFLQRVFPEAFGTLSRGDVEALFLQRKNRTLLSGSLFFFGNEGLLGYTVLTERVTPSELVNDEELRLVRERLQDLLPEATLAWIPVTPDEKTAAGEGSLGSSLRQRLLEPNRADAEVYTPGVAYGYLRRLRGDDVENNDALVAPDQVLILDRNVSALPGTVAALLTAEPQGRLSHLAVLSAQRGTVNAYVADAYELHLDWEGQLVRVVASRAGVDLALCTDIDEAEAFWAKRRETSDVPPPLFDELEVVSLDKLPVGSQEERQRAKRRFGAKGTNLALLRTFTLGDVEVPEGLVVSVDAYRDFMASNWMTEEPEQPSYEEFVAALPVDIEERHDALERFAQHAERHALVSEAFLSALAKGIRSEFGVTDIMVRVRSSSNAEDSTGFTGAGLYDSDSACLADDEDADSLGPCRCDANQSRERPLRDAVVAVWASLWTPRAVEERAYFGIAADAVAMGLLVSRRYGGEDANGVLFTRRPDDTDDDRRLAMAQWGEVDAVSSPSGLLPEEVLFRTQDGELTQWSFISSSSLLPADRHLLDEDALQRLDALARVVEASYPRDGLSSELPVAFDLEWKLLADRRLVAKQVRPFVGSAASSQSGTDGVVEIVQNAPLQLCTTFLEGRQVLDERKRRGRVVLDPLVASITLDGGAAERRVDDWVSNVETGPEGEALESLDNARMNATLAEENGIVHVVFEDTFAGPTTSRTLRFESYAEQLPGGDAIVVLQEGSEGFRLLPEDGGAPSNSPYLASCTMDELPLWSTVFRVQDPGFPVSSIEFVYRHQPHSVETAPLRLREAIVRTRDDATTSVDGFFDLTYATQRHNEAEQFLVRIPGLPNSAEFVWVKEPWWTEPHEADIYLLDNDMLPVDFTQTEDFADALHESPR